MAKATLKQVSGEKGFSFDGGNRKEKKILPKISFHGVELPEIEDWEIGKKYRLVVEAELVAVRKGSEYEFEDEDKRTKGTFKVHQVGVEPKDETFAEETVRRRDEAMNKQ